MGESDDSTVRVLTNDFSALWRDIRDDSLSGFERVGASGRYILGRELKCLEERLAAEFSVAHAVGCGSGLDALEIALRAAGVRPADQILTTPLSAFATTLAILRAGGIPVFTDVDDAGLIDLDEAEAYLVDHPEVRFFLPVHLYGHALDLDRLRDLSHRYGVVVIEDCAQAIGASWEGIACGSAGTASAVSFYPTKNLGALGDGGALLTNDPALAEKARILRDYGQSAKYVHTELGLNSRLDEIQAAIITDALLPRLPSFTSRRRAVADRYRRSIANPGIELPAPPSGSASVWHLFPIMMVNGRDSLRSHLAASGIQTGVHYPVCIPDQPAMTQKGDGASLDIENARRIARSELSIPIHPYLSDDDVQRVIDACNNWS